MITSALKWLLDHVPVALIPPQFQLALSLLRGLVPLLGYIGGFIAWSWSAVRVFDRGTPKTLLAAPPCTIYVRFITGCGVTLTATWLLPIAIIPGTWQVYEVPGTPQLTAGQAASQPELNEGAVSAEVHAEAQKEGGPIEGKAPNQDVPEPKASASQEPGRDQAWGSSSTYISKQQQPQDHWDPSPSLMWIYPEHGYPNPMYSSSNSFHHTPSHYPPGAYVSPMPGYAAPMYGYYQSANPEQPTETYESAAYGPAAPPPVLVHTVPLPSSRPNTPPRRR